MPTAENPHRPDTNRPLAHWTAWMPLISMIIGAIANAVAIIQNIGHA